MSTILPITEHVLDPVQISIDQFLDCAQALIHTILFYRGIESQCEPKSIIMNGLDIAYVTSESSENSESIRRRLIPMEEMVFQGFPDAWVILTLSYNTSKKGWFRDVQTADIWERWCFTFSFSVMTAREMRETMLHAITQITQKANSCEIPKKTGPNAVFQYSLSLPSDKDWESSKEIVKLFHKVVKTPATVFQ